MADDITYEVNTIFKGVDQISGPTDTMLRAQGSAALQLRRIWQDLARGQQDDIKNTYRLFDQYDTESLRKRQASANAHGQAHQEGAKQAADAHKKAAKETETVWGEALKTVKGQMVEAFSVYAIEEFLRHSYTGYAKTEENMRRLQVAIGGSNEEIEHLKGNFQSLAAETGRSLGELTTSFRDFMARSGLEGHEAENAFKGIAEAADLAGVPLREMSSLVGTVMADMHTKLDDMPRVLGEVTSALARLGPGAAAGIGRIMDTLTKIGTPDIDKVRGLAEEAAKMTGGVQQGLAAIQSVVDMATDPNSQFRRRNVALVEAFSQGAADEVDIVIAAVRQEEEILRMAHGSRERRQILEKAWGLDNVQTQKLITAELYKTDEAIRQHLSPALSEVEKKHAEFTQGGIQALRELSEKWEILEDNVGVLLEKLGASQALTEFANTIEKISKAIEKMRGGDISGGAKDLLGWGETTPEEQEEVKKKMWVNLPKAFWRGLGLGGVTGYQTGGVAGKQGPELAMLGEAGPELVVPLNATGGGGEATPAQKEAADMWNRLHSEAMLTTKHADLKGQLSETEWEDLLKSGAMGGAGAGGAGGRDTGWGPGSGAGTSPGGSGAGNQSTTGGTGTPPPPRGVTGSPLGGVHGNLPFGLNVDPQRFSAITGLPPSFMNVSPESAARAAQISRGGGVGMGGEFVGGKTGADWPTVGAAGLTGGNPSGPAKVRSGQDTRGVDPRLVSIITEASKSLPEGYSVGFEAGVGNRPGGSRSYHPHGLAEDVRIYGPDGKPVGGKEGWYQSPQQFRLYEQFAQSAKQAQMRMYPQGPGFAWGGYFVNKGPGSYGFADLMHMQLGGPMAGGTWEGGAQGITKQWLERGGGTSVGMGAGLAGGGFPTVSTAASTGPVTVSPITSGMPAGTWEGGGASSTATGGGDAGDYERLADAIGKQEGYGHAGNIPTSQNNPGDLKWGPFAKAHGATGPGRGGHAIFPDYQTGRNALISLLQTKGAGQSIAQIGRWWAEDPTWASKVAANAGVSPNFVPKIREAMQSPDPATRAKGTMLFLQGIEAREKGQGRTPADQEAAARRIAAARGLGFEAIGGAQGSAEQERQARERLKQGGITDVEGFSMGGYTANRLRGDFPGVNFDALGATKSGEDPRFPGVHHLDLMRAMAESEEAKAAASGRVAGPGIPSTATASRGLKSWPGGRERSDVSDHAAAMEQIRAQHSALQDHLDKNPIKTSVADTPLNGGKARHAFARQRQWVQNRNNARHTAHTDGVDSGPM